MRFKLHSLIAQANFGKVEYPRRAKVSLFGVENREVLDNRKFFCKLKTKIVIFFGPQGSGKTTLIEFIGRELKKKGFKVRKVEIMYNHLFAYIMYKLLIQLGFYEIYTIGHNKLKRVKRTLLRRLGTLWLYLNLISTLLLVFIRVWVPLHLGYVVLAERYITDTYVSLIWGCKLLKAQSLEYRTKNLSRFLFRFVPTNATMICLDAEYDVLYQRYLRTGKPVEDREYIELQRAYGQIFMRMFKRSMHVSTDRESVEQSKKKIFIMLNNSKN
ncbi:MAG: hypothetical protein QW193_01680 [Nitrososphaerales archaeon]